MQRTTAIQNAKPVNSLLSFTWSVLRPARSTSAIAGIPYTHPARFASLRERCVVVESLETSAMGRGASGGGDAEAATSPQSSKYAKG